VKTIKIIKFRNNRSQYGYCEAAIDKKSDCGVKATKELVIAGGIRHYFFCEKHYSQLKEEMKELVK